MAAHDREDIVLAGASGRVGRLLRRAWSAAPGPGAGLVPIARRPGPGTLAWDSLEAPGALSRLLAGRASRVAAMVVLTGITPGPGVRLDLNAPLARGSLEGARAAGIERVLFASSAAVYGPGGGRRPFSEQDPPAPATAYGAAKRDAEAEVARFRDLGMEVAILRIGNVLGADALMRSAENATPDAPLALDRFASGHGPVRSYIGPLGLARVIAALAMHPGPLPDLLNVAAPEPVAMEDLLQAAGVPWRWTPAPGAAQERVTLDCARLTPLLPGLPLAETAAAMVAEGAALPPLPAA